MIRFKTVKRPSLAQVLPVSGNKLKRRARKEERFYGEGIAIGGSIEPVISSRTQVLVRRCVANADVHQLLVGWLENIPPGIYENRNGYQCRTRPTSTCTKSELR